MADNKAEIVDLTIVGGGPVAKTLGLLLASAGWKIAMVAPATPPPGNRAIALNLGSKKLLSSIGVWPALSSQSGEISEIQVSKRHEFAKSYLRAADIQQQQLGFVVEESILLKELDQQLLISPSIIQVTASPTDIRNSDTDLTLNLCDRAPIQTRLLIAADGIGSAIRQMAGLPAKQHDFHSTAISATVSLSEPHNGRAWERFTDRGPIALLPLATADQYSLVFCSETYQSKQLMAMNQTDFVQELQLQFGYSAGVFTNVMGRYAYPLLQKTVPKPVGQRLLLIGSAARHIHPVAGQGLNLALRDCSSLNQLLSEAAISNADPGSELLLQQYNQSRLSDWRLTEQFTGRIPGLFASLDPATTLGRNLAITALELFSPLRKAFIRRATGQF